MQSTCSIIRQHISIAFSHLQHEISGAFLFTFPILCSVSCCFIETWPKFTLESFLFDCADVVAGSQSKSNESKEELDLQIVLESGKKAVMQGSLDLLMVYVSCFFKKLQFFDILANLNLI